MADITDAVTRTVEDTVFFFSNKISKLLGSEYETDSLCAMCHRENWQTLEFVFDIVFAYKEDNHCKRSNDDLMKREDQSS